MWLELAGHRASELMDFRAVFLGGGNTFALWHTLQRAGMIDGLRAYSAHGGWLAGNSAGALICGLT